MRKAFYLLLLTALVVPKLKAQTAADFVSDTVCLYEQTSLTDVSISSGNITQVNWDLDNDGLFNDGTQQVFMHMFDSFKVYKVGLQVISDIPDTSVIYKNVYLRPLPEARVYQPYGDIQCLGANSFDFIDTSVISSGSITKYVWDFGDGKTSISKDSLGMEYQLSGKKVIEHVAISNYGCKDTTYYNVEITTISKADFTIDDSIQCSNTESFTFTDNSMICGASPAISWDLNNNGKFDDSVGQSSFTMSFGDTGTYKVGFRVVTATDRDSIYKTVVVLPSSIPSFTINDSTQCQTGNDFSFTNTSSIKKGNFTSFWKFGNGDTLSASNITSYNYAAYGDFTVTLVNTSDMGCVDSVSQDVHVYESPMTNFMTNDTIQCLGDTFSFINTSFINAPYKLVYSWDFGDGATAISVTDTSHTYLAGGTYSVILYATSDSGCMDSMIQNVRVLTQSYADFIINDSTQCEKGNSFTFTNLSSNCSPIDTILWDFDNDGVYAEAGGNMVSFQASGPGTFPISMQLITTSDTTYQTHNIYVYPSPVAGFTVNDSTQEITTNNFIFTNTSTIASGSQSFSWYLGDGWIFGSTNPVKTYGKTGIYTVILYDTSNLGCVDTFAKKVYVVSPVTAGFKYTTVCFGDSTEFTDTSKSSTAIQQYNWDLDNDGVFGDATGATIKYKFAYADTFKVGLQVITATSKDTAWNNVIVHPEPKADFTFTNACFGSTTDFKDNSTITNDYIAKYYWDFDGNGTVDDSSGAVTSYQFPTAGAYVGKLLVVTSNGCSDEASQTVKVNQAPTAGFTFSNACVGDSVKFVNTSSIGANDSIINFLWTYGDGTDAIIRDDHTHFYSSEGDYTVTLVVLSSQGCKGTDTQNIHIYPKPSVSITPSSDTIFYKGDKIDLDVGSGYKTIMWSSGESTAKITVDQTGGYIVTVSDTNNCFNSASIQVLVKDIPEVDATNVFTPNGDGVNDYFVLKDIDAFAPVTLTIYNRWGDVLYTSTAYKNDWDGTYKGAYLAEGTYYYILKTKDGKVVKSTVNILK